MLDVRLGFNHVKLRNKLIILYVLSVFLPIVLTNIIFYHMTTSDIKQQKINDVSLILDQISNDFLHVVGNAIEVSTTFYTDSLLYDFFDTEYESSIEYVEAYNLHLRTLNRYRTLNPAIQSIAFYTDNSSMIFSGGVHPITDSVQQTAWYQELSKVSHPFVIRTSTGGMRGVLSVVWELDFFHSYQSHQKILKIDFNPDMLEQIFENVTFQGNVYLINGQGHVEYTTDQSVDWEREVTPMSDITLAEDTLLVEDKHLAQNYLKDWKIKGVITESEILDELHGSRRFMVLLTSLNFLIPTLIIVWISRSLTSRLSRIVEYMRRMKKQSFESIPYHGDKDEIGELTQEFNRMSQTIHRLINEVYIANIQKKELDLQKKQAQLSALKSQIKPHFLFNALETIRMRSLIKDEHETAKIIHNMAKIFRNSISWDKDWVTVQEELHLIECFLEIQQYRFDDKLSYEMIVDEEAYSFMIPNMTFLPFIENASIHGIEPLKGNGKIQIQVELKEGELLFILKDNGVGMTNERLEELLHNLYNDESMGDHIGIQNVYYRLKLYYQNDFDLRIDSNENGTTIHIRLPRQQRKGLDRRSN
ncbi:sensor histidine kinase [Bacillus horti]|uniref:Two-component system sensor histidine kinase YesM n=1 Tax=Caldalkalibacillus horti TaxID=77523 RepID=A0ABT9W2J1_9BACI|nr:sensor histidine kinase [Bacillus horti]MDQ0167468.1 two-component system sensor histidine kinase YesM [Bacillus horti]